MNHCRLQTAVRLKASNNLFVMKEVRQKENICCWESPANIALVKYWGKKGDQIPANPSISLTLKKSVTKTTLSWPKKDVGRSMGLKYFFNRERHKAFEDKIISFMEELRSYFPFIDDYQFEVQSLNTFPHSAGIASSASSMSAFVLCLLSMEEKVINRRLSKDDFLKRASFLSRLGSGSACRSVYPYAALWGRDDIILAGDDQYASALCDIDPIFKSYQNSILVIDSTPKSTSSRQGHRLMDNHPYASIRYERARKHCREIIHAMRDKDLTTFIEIVEKEALELHGLMMTSDPSYILLKPNSLELMVRIRNFRQDSGTPVCFTLDAGPNIHLLYPRSYKKKVEEFIKNELLKFTAGGLWISDEIGSGPIKHY